MNIRLLNKNTYEIEKIAKIFFNTSEVKQFKSSQDKKEFFYKYLGHYIECYENLFYVAVEGTDILGYVCGCPDSLSDSFFESTFRYYKETPNKTLESFPAHLHINLSEKSQGKGVGSKLINELLAALRSLNIKGVHIYTGFDHPSINFYKKNGFRSAVSLEYNSSKILMMSKELV